MDITSAAVSLATLAASVLVLYATTSWGLWKMAKALRVENPGDAWIPFRQVTTLLQVVDRSRAWLAVALIVSAFTGLWVGATVLLLGGGFAWALGAAASMGAAKMGALTVTLLAERLGRGQGAAVGLFLLPFVFFPALGWAAEKKSAV